MKKTIQVSTALFFMGITSAVYGQPDYKSQMRCNDADIPHYIAQKINDTLTVDGKLDEDFWKNASRSKPFTDIISGADAYLDTHAAVLWDDQNLYVGYWIEEPHVTATFTRRDAPIYKNNDVELFIGR